MSDDGYSLFGFPSQRRAQPAPKGLPGDPGGGGGPTFGAGSNPFGDLAGDMKMSFTPISTDPRPGQKDAHNYQGGSHQQQKPVNPSSTGLTPKGQNTNDGDSITKARERLQETAQTMTEMKGIIEQMEKLEQLKAELEPQINALTDDANDQQKGDGGDNAIPELTQEQKDQLEEEYREGDCKDCPEPGDNIIDNTEAPEETEGDADPKDDEGDDSSQPEEPAWSETFMHSLRHSESFGFVFSSSTGIHLGNASLLGVINMYNDPSRFAPGESHTSGAITLHKYKYGKSCFTYVGSRDGGSFADSNANNAYNLLRSYSETVENLWALEIQLRNAMKHLNGQISSLGIDLSVAFGSAGASQAKKTFQFNDSFLLSYQQNGDGVFGMENLGPNMYENGKNMIKGMGKALYKSWDNLTYLIPGVGNSWFD